MNLIEKSSNVVLEDHPARDGLVLMMTTTEVSVSSAWSMGAFDIQFVGLPEGESLRLNRPAHPVYLKVISGEISEGHRRAFPAPGTTTSTVHAEDIISAIEPTVLCLISDSETGGRTVTAMDQLSVSGPESERFSWQTFDERFGAFTSVFAGLDAHMLSGFHLRSSEGSDIAYAHFWTTGKGADASTHNHAQDPSPSVPAFAEIHLVLRNGTGEGGMYHCETRDAPAQERVRTVMQAGEEHGPFFRLDEATGKPLLRPNGAVDYPWHGWQGGTDDQPGQAYDLVAAFEIYPEFVKAG